MTQPTRSRSFLVIAVILAAFVSGGWFVVRGSESGFSARSGAHLFDQVLAHVQQFYVDSIPAQDVFEKAVVGLLDELDDPYTSYLEGSRLRRIAESTTGNYTGLGVRFDSRDNFPVVIAPLPGSPAERAGLLAGDRIVEIGGRPTKGWTDGETRASLRGEVGSSVVVTVDRPGLGRRLSLTLIRGEIHRRAVRRTALLPDGVGYVDVDIFSDSTETELAHAIDSLQREGLQSVIIDLRSNPGGLLAQGVAVADLFLNAGQTIVGIHGRTPETNRVYADSAPERWPSLPMAVLIDEATASASEIVAGALQDHDRAVIVGLTSLGKGSAQSVFPTLTGGGVKLTTARWYTPLGRSITRIPDTTSAPEAAEDEPGGKRFTTPSGRTVFGGGGITPDIMAGDSALTPAEARLQNALGDRVTQFRDALTAYAVSLKIGGTLRNEAFTVTNAMFDEAWRMVRQRGFQFDRRIFDDARPLVNRLLVREITRTVFGADAEVRRSIRDDQIIQTAAELLRVSASPSDAIQRISAGAPGS